MHVMNRAGKVTRRAAATPTRARRAPAWPLVALLWAVFPTASVHAEPQGEPQADGVVAPAAQLAPSADLERAARAPERREKLRDVADWVKWKAARQITSLPAEARLFYRRGLIANQSGQHAEALENVRGAIVLDPSFIQPHLTLASWSLWSDPSQTLVHCAAVVDRLRHDFNLQLDLVANTLTLGFEALFAGLLFAGLLILVLRAGELAHGFEEQLGVVLSRWSARLWVTVMLCVPFLAGVGLTLPVLLMLGFLWTPLRVRERALLVLLGTAAVFAPLAFGALDRFALALGAEQRPFYELPMLEHMPWSSDRQSRLEALARRDPDSGFVQFALGWYSRRDGRLEEAERAYAAALKAWPEHSAVLTDLGNVVAMRGDVERALSFYQRAAKSDPLNAAAHFNASQLLTRRFDYTTAQAELRLASAIDFELVKRYQASSGANGQLPLADVWPGPRTFWTALLAARAPEAMPLPLSLRGWRESSGWSFSVAAVVVLAAGIVLGRWQHRRLPLRYCSNCGTVVCRRCAKRRREAALCQECDRIGAGAETQEFSRVLLLQHQASRRNGARYVRAALATLVPGFGLLSHHRVFGPTLLLAFTWLLGRFALGHALPFSVTSRLALPGGEVPGVMLWVGAALVYAWSLFGYYLASNAERRREAQAAVMVSRARATQSTKREPSVAA